MEDNNNYLLSKGESEQIIVHNIENSDIFRILQKGDTFCIVVGNNIVSTKEFDSFDSALSYIDSKPYELIINLCALVVKNIINEKI